MADQLKLDGSDLNSVQTRIDDIFDILNNGALFKDDTANAVGHERLAAKVREFSDNWNDRRDDVIERLQYIKDTLSKIEVQFDDLDSQLTTALTAPASDSSPADGGTSGGGGGR